MNNKPVTGTKPGEYLALSRRWSPGDAIRLQLDMVPQVVQGSPRIADDTGRVAVQRGPLIYCLEELDQPSGVALSDVALDLGTGSSEAFQSRTQADLLGGIVVLQHMGVVYERSAAENALYSRYSGKPPKTRKVDLRLIPYYAWANRHPTAMQVWTPLYKA